MGFEQQQGHMGFSPQIIPAELVPSNQHNPKLVQVFEKQVDLNVLLLMITKKGMREGTFRVKFQY